MSLFEIAALLGTGVGSALAAYESRWSPRAKERRQDRANQRQFYADWNGAPERRGPAGDLIAPAQPGVMERLGTLEMGMLELHDKVDVPILNGGGERLIEQVDDAVAMIKRLDGRTRRNTKRLTELENR